MKTSHIIIILGVIFGSSVTFAVLQPVSQEQALSKQCDIPHDVDFGDRGKAISGPNDGKPHYSIEEEFSIFYTVPIGEFRVDDVSRSLILKPVSYSHGYIIMCNPLPVLEKRFETKLDRLFILVDNEEIEPNLINDVLRIDINNNSRIEIMGTFKI